MNAEKPIRILVVDDHDMLRRGLALFLVAFPNLTLVGDTGSGSEAIDLCQQIHPDVVLMDLVMPEMDGVTAIERIHQIQPEIKIIALSSYHDESLVKAALQAGATSYILKNVSPDKLAEAIQAAQSGLPSLSPEIISVLVSSARPDYAQPEWSERLSQREKEVLAKMASGLSNSQIAEELNISENTTKGYVSAILAKLNVKSRTEAVALVFRSQTTPD